MGTHWIIIGLDRCWHLCHNSHVIRDAGLEVLYQVITGMHDIIQTDTNVFRPVCKTQAQKR